MFGAENVLEDANGDDDLGDNRMRTRGRCTGVGATDGPADDNPAPDVVISWTCNEGVTGGCNDLDLFVVGIVDYRLSDVCEIQETS